MGRMEQRTEELLALPYWLVDALPEQVPADGPGRFFAVEELLLAEAEARAGQFSRLLLKLYCYCDLTVAGRAGALRNPPPAVLARAVRRCVLDRRRSLRVYVDGGQALITLWGDDLYMTVYGADARLRRLLGALAAAEGLFFRPGPGQAAADSAEN